MFVPAQDAADEAASARKIGRELNHYGLHGKSGLTSGRRSTRIRAQIPLRVTSLDPATPFSESGHTLVVNTQGCGVRLSRALEPGLAVSLDDLPAGKV